MAPEGIREDVWDALRSARLWRDASDEAVEWLARVAEIVEVVVETNWPSEVIGSVAAFGEMPFEADIESVEDATIALIPLGTIKDLLATEPAVAMSVIGEIARRWVSVVNANKRNSVDVVSRVIAYLEELPRTRLGAAAYSVEIPMARVELAALLGTTPETLSRAFRSLQDEALIESHDRMIIVPDGEQLSAKNVAERPAPARAESSLPTPTPR